MKLAKGEIQHCVTDVNVFFNRLLTQDKVYLLNKRGNKMDKTDNRIIARAYYIDVNTWYFFLTNTSSELQYRIRTNFSNSTIFIGTSPQKELEKQQNSLKEYHHCKDKDLVSLFRDISIEYNIEIPHNIFWITQGFPIKLTESVYIGS